MPDSARRLFHGIASLPLVCPVALFLYFVRCADAAMDKSGLGDAVAWHAYQAKAGVAFQVAVGVWVSLLLIAALKPSFRPAAITACAIVPVVATVAWLALLAS